jgi:hypothetical protein
MAVGIAVVLTGVIAVSGLPAQAATAVQPASVVSVWPSADGNQGETTQGLGGANQYSAICGGPATNCLPVNRWSDATTAFHTRLSFDISDLAGSTTRMLTHLGTRSWAMSLGNTFWSWTMMSISYATNMDPLRSAGAQMDHLSSRLGHALITSPLAAILVAAAVIAAMWAAWRKNEGTRAFRSLGRVVLTVAFMSTMVASAGMSTGSGDDYRPAVMSPGWIAQTMSTLVNVSTDGITESIVDSADIEGITVDSGKPLDCSAYTDALRAEYKNKAGVNRGTTGAVMALNGLWEQTGLNAWITMQLDSGPTAYRTYCHLLEWQANVSPSSQYAVQRAANDALVPGSSQKLSLAFGPANVLGTGDDAAPQDEVVDRAMVGWAACHPDGGGRWSLDDSWQGLNGASADDVSKQCQAWWTEAADASGGEGTVLDIKDKQANITSSLKDASPEARAFTMALHGESAPGGSIAPFLFAITALIDLAVFGVMSIIVIVTKIGMLIYLGLVMIVLLVSLWPGKADDKLVEKFFKGLLGMTFISWGYSLILAFMVLITSLISSMVGGGVTSATPANQFAAALTVTPASTNMTSMLVGTVAPLAAIWIIGKLFTDLLHMPNPLSVRGALAFGSMSGAVGGAALSELWDRTKGVAKTGTKRAVDTAKNSLSGSTAKASATDHGLKKGQGGMADAAGLPEDGKPMTADERAQAEKNLGERAAALRALKAEERKRKAVAGVRTMPGRVQAGAKSIGEKPSDITAEEAAGIGAKAGKLTGDGLAVVGDKARRAAGVADRDAWRRLGRGGRAAALAKAGGLHAVGLNEAEWRELSTARRAGAVFATPPKAVGATIRSVARRTAPTAKRAIGLAGEKWDRASRGERARAIAVTAAKAGVGALAIGATAGTAAPVVAALAGRQLYRGRRDEVAQDHEKDLLAEVARIRDDAAAVEEARKQGASAAGEASGSEAPSEKPPEKETPKAPEPSKADVDVSMNTPLERHYETPVASASQADGKPAPVEVADDMSHRLMKRWQDSGESDARFAKTRPDDYAEVVELRKTLDSLEKKRDEALGRGKQDEADRFQHEFEEALDRIHVLQQDSRSSYKYNLESRKRMRNSV